MKAKNKCNHKVYYELSKEVKRVEKKLDEVYHFMYDNKDNCSSIQEKELIDTQASIMSSYLRVLAARLSYLENA